MTKLPILLMVVLLLSACNSKKEEELPRRQQRFPMPLLSAENPGRWKDYSKIHVPKIEFKQNDGELLLNVTVPLEARPGHYIEKIVIADYRGRELVSTVFKLEPGYPGMVFAVPEDYNERLLVIGRCNLHDMWVTEAFPSKFRKKPLL